MIILTDSENTCDKIQQIFMRKNQKHLVGKCLHRTALHVILRGETLEILLVTSKQDKIDHRHLFYSTLPPGVLPGTIRSRTGLHTLSELSDY